MTLKPNSPRLKVMLGKAKKAIKDVKKVPDIFSLQIPAWLPLRGRDTANADDIEKARSYIADYWNAITRTNVADKDTLIGLPYPYLVPSPQGKSEFMFDEQYYWDSYFMIISHNKKEDEEFVEGMLDNLIYLFNRFGLVPNASRMYFTGRSQPPLLTSFIFHVYDTFNKSEDWLKERIAVAEKEYTSVWTSPHHPQFRLVHKGLSRYYDVNSMHDLAELESGWDMTPRFERKCLDYLPIDLNSLLYKYEMDFARAASIFADKKAYKNWNHKAEDRKHTMDKLMWGKLRGFYFDYDFVGKQQSNTWSLAGYYPLWAGMADDKQASRLVDNLRRFDRKGGLTTTLRPLIDMTIFGSLKTQWGYPNGWAPLHFMVVEGLKRYGYYELARQVALKWVNTNAVWFRYHNEFLEKYNVITPRKKPLEGVYPSQTGFGWTNAVFERFCQEFIDD